MAYLSRDYEDDRGQLILVTAFMLAVTFVALALVVNSAIFTENMATRDDVAGSHEALDFRSEVEANAGELITQINNDSDLDTTDKMNNSLKIALENLSTEAGFHQASQGRLVNISWNKDSATWGKRIAQDNSTRNFSSAAGEKGWNVTDDEVEEIRDFTMNVTSISGSFEVHVNDTESNDKWRMKISPSGTKIEVEIDHPDHGTETCTRSHDDYTIIDVTAGTVAGEPCLALGQLQDEDGTERWIGTGVGDDFRIEFKDSKVIEGTYSFVIGDQGDLYPSPLVTKLVDGHSADKPYYADAFYNLTVSYEFYTSAVGYETKVRVAPGEVPS